jgi:hypothetical protein
MLYHHELSFFWRLLVPRSLFWSWLDFVVSRRRVLYYLAVESTLVS